MKRNQWLFALIVILIIGSAIVDWKIPAELGLDLVGGVRGVFRAGSQSTGRHLSQSDMDQALQVLVNRVNKLGVSEAQVQQKGTDQFIVELPLSGEMARKHLSGDDAMKALMDVVKPAFLEFVEFPPDIHVDLQGRDAKGVEQFRFTGADGQPLSEAQAIEQAKVILTGHDLLPDASAQMDPNKGGFSVSLHFDPHGSDIFGQYTEAHVPQNGQFSSFGVLLDKHLITYPRIESAIPDGNGEISGGFSTLNDAQNLAVLLNAGALPVTLTPLQTSLVEATLGRSAVATSKWAGIVGLALVIIFMCLYYRLPGLLATAALLIYALYTFALFKLIPVAFTLPGIAGFILSVGMAVDANILIFERLKEELRDGRTLRSAIDVGFGRALTAILDSNACTLITCAVLGFYGTGPVKGFAITLALGVLVSLFTAVIVTRNFLHLLDNQSALQKPEYFGVNVQWMGKWAQGRDIIGRRKFYYGLSLFVILPGFIFLCLGQMRRGVDFTGGDEWILRSRQTQLTDARVATALGSVGIARDKYDLQIGSDLRTGERLATIHAQPGVLKADQAARNAQERAVLDALHQEGVTDAAQGSIDHIDPLIGKELELNAVKAVIIASALIVLYLSYRFAGLGGFKNGLKYGVCAIIAMLHDVLVVMGLFAIFGMLFQVEIDMNFVTAILTIIGFSVHDTIVIFDRVRENLVKRGRDESFEVTYNKSIVQTFARSINTSFTVVLVLLALALFGAPVIRWFNIALLIGIISGTYSSIFNASPLVVDWTRIKRARELAAPGGVTRVQRGPEGFGARTDGAPRRPAEPASPPRSNGGQRTDRGASAPSRVSGRAQGTLPSSTAVIEKAPDTMGSTVDDAGQVDAELSSQNAPVDPEANAAAAATRRTARPAARSQARRRRF